MSGEDNSNNNSNNPPGTPTAPGGTASGTPPVPPCVPRLGVTTLTVTGSTVILGPFDFAALTRAFADMLRSLATLGPMLCRASVCAPSCSCIPVPISLPVYYVTFAPAPGIPFPVPTLNVDQSFKPFCY